MIVYALLVFFPSAQLFKQFGTSTAVTFLVLACHTLYAQIFASLFPANNPNFNFVFVIVILVWTILYQKSFLI